MLDGSKKESYKDFVDQCPHAMLYHGWEYKEFLKSLLAVDEHYLLVVNEAGKISGALPLLCKNGPYGNVYNSLPFYGSNGGILSNDEESFNFLVEGYNKFVRETNLASSTVISNPLKTEDSYIHITQNYTDYRIGQFSTIKFEERHEDSLMNMFHYKTRNMVRKGIKEGVKVFEENEAIDFVIDTHEKNMSAIGGKPKPRSFFKLFPTFYKPGIDYKIYTAKINGKAIAALLLFYFNDTVEYYSPVIVEEFRDKQALSLIIYEAMIEASKRGYKRWNWGGTWASQGGVYTFKKRWGTYDVNYHYYTLLKNESILTKSKGELLKHYDNFFVIAFNELKN
ncbi:MAG TPA: GNAT family N-acetyltransferase [Nitrosopumilaceae archaeon]|nr:GNAT family N-acetyltransferase [Nitrosopumilaceae archaeon]